MEVHFSMIGKGNSSLSIQVLTCAKDELLL